MIIYYDVILYCEMSNNQLIVGPWPVNSAKPTIISFKSVQIFV